MSNIPTRIDKILQQFIKEVTKIYGERIKKIILYGSYARGDYKENSDLDIMLLTDLTEEEIIDRRTELWNVASDIGLENDILISASLKNIEDFNYWNNTLPFYMNIEKEGVILNG